MEDLIKNMMFDINYHPLYFITAHQGRIESGKITLLYNLHKKEVINNWYYIQASDRALDELKEVLIKLGVK